MRITYKMMTTKYTTNLNNMSTELDRLNTQVASGRKFAKTSEDTSSAIKAYQIRRDLAKLDGYQNNIAHASDYLTNSETNLGDITETLADATDKILQGKNDTQNPDTRKIIANELRVMQKQMLDTLNSKVGDSYIFGGSNTVEKPFTVDEDGKLLYNKIDVDSLDDSTQALKDTLNNLKADSLYVDIGLGVSVDSAGTVNPNTIFNYSIPGINIVGNGTTTIDGIAGNVSNNAYNLLGKIAEQFESANYSSDITDKLFGKFQSATSQASKATTEIGAKANYLEFMKERYDSQELNLQTRQTEVEGIDAAYTYISFQTQKVAYQAALQMGNSIIQSSVFDYMS
ncbi:flagellar hook-associated protein FlgL [Acetobacterium bakii]|uniref:Flagellin N-terminal domain-containing protein n=1 Tax=Acetobacterium bakii TaxID=52689 RepID=A0A0L6U2B4_9FIRM|nr:flagellar hook-associated protein FlgL [Acetobacterium bakii]KNZ42651.1 hypothetical protein AKG39_05805 [Acetobacterium bakii]